MNIDLNKIPKLSIEDKINATLWRIEKSGGHKFKDIFKKLKQVVEKNERKKRGEKRS